MAGIKIRNERDGYDYELRLVKRLGPRGRIGVASTKADRPSNNIVYNFGGKDNQFPIQWTMYDWGDDLSLGTAASIPDTADANFQTDGNGDPIVQSLREQIWFFDRFIQIGTISTQWRLYDIDDNGNVTGGFLSDPDGDGSNEGLPVVIESTDLPEEAGLLAGRAQMQVRLGQVV